MNFCSHTAYIYPITSRGRDMTPEYIFYFIDSLKDHFEIVNREKPSAYGSLDLLKYLNKIDFLFLNWPEDLPDKKGGLIQTVIFCLCIYYLKIRKVKIIYTLHNKVSHKTSKARLKDALRKFIMGKADLVITHAKEGIDIAKKIIKKNNHKIAFYCHPVLSKIEIQPDIEKKYDVLIWGKVEPYKAIDKFISLVNERKLFDIKILIAGRIKDESLKQTIMSIKPKNVEVIDKFISEAELIQFVSESKSILFTYSESSILSSGALMDSLRFSTLILGPDIGAFRDIAEEGLIYTYKDFNELAELLGKINKLPVNKTGIDKFIENNQWSGFGRSLNKILCSM